MSEYTKFETINDAVRSLAAEHKKLLDAAQRALDAGFFDDQIVILESAVSLAKIISALQAER